MKITKDMSILDVVQKYPDTVGVFIQTYHLRGKGRFIGTTNMNAKDLGVKYGSRIVDRLLEMCVVMRFDGASKRERIII